MTKLKKKNEMEKDEFVTNWW